MWHIVTDRIAWCVSLSVYHSSEPCKNGSTNQDAIWAKHLGELKEPCTRWGFRSPWEEAITRGKGVVYGDSLPLSSQKNKVYNVHTKYLQDSIDAIEILYY